MKKSFVFTLIAFLFSLIVLSGFEDAEDTASPAFTTKKYVLDELAKTRQKIKELYQANESKDIEQMRALLKATRIQYKTIEFYLESFESEYVKFLNGAPIPWVEFVGGGTDHQNPHGLQVLEEMVFEDEPDFEAIKMEIYFLNNELLKFNSMIEVNPTSDAMIFLGLKYGLIRMEALNLPGFDCAVTLQVAEEVYSSLETTYKVLEIYGTNYKNKPVIKDIQAAQKKIREAQKYLQPSKGKFLDFEAIDKLVFIKKYLQPINVNIVDIFEAIKVEQPVLMRIFQYLTYINGKAKNIYDPDFLDRVATGERTYYGLDHEEKLNPEIVALGKKLFNDTRLSASDKMSCSTCHINKLAFTDGLPTAITNVDGVFQKRNVPSLTYAAYQNRLFTDLRSRTLEEQVVHVVGNHEEFNTTFDDIIEKLSQDTALVNEFIKAFPKDWKKPVKEFTIRKALAGYVRSLGKFNSEFDAYMRGEIPDLPAEVKRGFNLFMGKAKCGTCHFAPTFSGTVPPLYRETETEVLGVLQKWDTLNPVLTSDSGRYHTQANPIYITSHKTATLRNIELTAPYMHNGQFKDLETVMDFYNRGGGVGMGLHIENQTLDDAPLNLSQQEINDIISFMKSLTDRQYLKKNVED